LAKGTLEALALELARSLQPLADRLTSSEILDLFAELGLRFPPALQGQASFVNALTGASSAISNLRPLIDRLETAIKNGDAAAMASVASQVINLVKAVAPALTSIGTELNAVAGALPGVNPADVNAFAGQLADSLMQFVVVTYLEGYHPVLLRMFTFAGIMELLNSPGLPADPTKPPFTQRKLRFDLIGNLLSSPDGHLQSLYQWGSPAFTGAVLLDRLHSLLSNISVPMTFDLKATPALRLLLLSLSPKTDINPPGLQGLMELSLPEGLAYNIPILDGRWAIELEMRADVKAGASFILQPPANLSLVPPDGTVQGKIAAGIARAPMPPDQDFELLGGGGSFLRAQRFSLHLTSTFAWDAGTKQARGGFGFDGLLRGGKLHIGTDSADGFIGTLLSGASLDAGFDLGLGWTAGQSVQFTGSGALQVQLPTHLSLGPVDVSAVTVGIGIQGAKFPITLSADITAALGPLTATVEQIGAAFTWSFPPGGHGNLGPAQLDFGFVPPKGVGLALDAGVVEGGGFLHSDPAHGEYDGALELKILGFLSVHGIGLISTIMPDGSKGFSLLIVITADFGPGIQLGFGFTLLAVGGLIGLNRTMLKQPLMDGVRTGAIESVMFPHDVVANAVRIISDLKAFFPPQRGTFLIGPMAKLGWGEPTLISLALGVIIEIPGDIAILGVLKLALPANDIAVILIQVNFAGVLEFDKSRLYFFATLFDSRVLFITIEGEMGVLFAWGSDANFVVSIGGFHPQFSPPPLPFPNPRRIEVDIINESFARIRCDGYFAVTSNTVQFGSHSEYFFGFTALSVEGHSGFDALLQFSPFHFTVTISTDFSVKVFGVGVYGVSIDLTLEGPTRWHAHGTASLSLFLVSVDIPIEFTWGDSRDTTLPPVKLMPIVGGELGKQSNWRAILPPGSNLLVSLRRLPAAESDMVLHPVGVLHVSQRAIPLNLTLDKAGNQAPSDANRFGLTVASAGLVSTGKLQEQFALAQFKNLADLAKLSQAAYSPMDSGLALSAAGNVYASGTAVTCNVRYDLTIVDTKLRRITRRFFVFMGSLFNHFLTGSSVAHSPLSAYRRDQKQPFADKVLLSPESFAVVVAATNSVYHPEAAAFTSRAAAQDYMTRAVASDSSLEGNLQVIPQFEVAA
jgi:hypothetical protein